MYSSSILFYVVFFCIRSHPNLACYLVSVSLFCVSPSVVPLQGLAHVGATTITVKAGEDFEAVCLHKVQPGDECYLEKGDYYHDGLTVTHGTAEKRITITGDGAACIKGGGDQDRVLQIAHDYYTIKGICFDGYHEEEEDREEQYVSTAIYVLGADTKSDKNGVLSSVTGLQMLDLEIKNFGSECVHFRYFVTHAEVSGCTVQRCGVDAFENGGGGKVGEAVYLGTALDQVNDGKVSLLLLLFIPVYILRGILFLRTSARVRMI